MKLRISALVIAHNEERFIGKCLDSILAQTIVPDEIVVLAHNCTDKTEEIVQFYPQVKLVSYQGPVGTVYARMKGFESVSDDVVCCIDGDATAKPNWIEELSKPFEDSEVVASHSPLIIKEKLLAPIATFRHFQFADFLRKFYKFRQTNFWGSSFAIRLSSYKKTERLESLIPLKAKLHLSEWCEDYYLFLILEKVGKIILTYKTMVWVEGKNSSIEMAIRGRKQASDAKKLWKFVTAK